MDVSISIVNYYSSELISQSIESIKKFTTGLRYEIIIVNNSILDIGINSIVNRFDDINIKLINLEQNSGFSRANNEAFKIAKGRYFLMYNPDIFLAENSILQCLKFLEKNEMCVCCTVRFIYPDGSYQASGFYAQNGARLFYNNIPNISRVINTSINYDAIVPLVKNDFVDIDVVCGAFVFMLGDVYHKIGGFDENFFLYGEDWEISNRIRKAGKIVLLNTTHVIHMHGGSSEIEFKEDGKELNLFSRKGTQMFVSILLWQKKEFGNYYVFKLFILIILGLFMNFISMITHKFRKENRRNFILLFKNCCIITKQVFFMIINKNRVYKTM